MRRRLHAVVAGLLVASLIAASCGDDRPSSLDSQLGGATSRSASGQTAFGLPAPSLTTDERRLFEVGDSLFTKNWVSAPSSTTGRDGLGPMFNAHACSGCHLRDGRGLPPAEDGTPRIGLLMRLSVPGSTTDGSPLAEPVYGGQLQDLSLDGTPAEGRVEVTYTERAGSYADGTTYSLRVPTYRIVDLAYGPMAPDVMMSPRLAPQVIGMGLLEAVPADTLLAAADPDDGDGDGISGRVNMVTDRRTSESVIGRFGWKAGQPTVEQQSLAAFNGDLGLTSSLADHDDCTAIQSACLDAVNGGEPEVTDDQMAAITFYGRVLAVPTMRDHTTDAVIDGSQAFADLGCAACHTPTLVTGEGAGPTLSAQTIHPYTDLLLHDMGDGLADHRPEFDATGTEWRTPPLWGIGLIDDVSGGERFLMHDGRARTIEEAILWHGGEAAAAAEAFRTASADVRAELIAFLEAL
jgi:CxxC motif-containing protein (DUF1111 family)